MMQLFHGWSRNRKLTFAWLVLAFLFFASAVVLLVVAEVWRLEASPKLGKHTLRTLVMPVANLNSQSWSPHWRLRSSPEQERRALAAATVLGLGILTTLVLGFYGFLQSYGVGNGKKAGGMIAFSWCLVGTMLLTIVVGSIMWFFSLTERARYLRMWVQQDGATQVFLQDSLRCCGYFNASIAGSFTQQTGFCSTIAGGNATAIQGCVTPITGFADYLLENTFTTIYGFTAIQLALFLVSCCLIISRREEERFRFIDEKRGTRGGFV
ncbi:hypothetical protein JCM1841_005495 [Sporobolomyces salmonicolor]